MLQNPFLHPKRGEIYNFCHISSFRHTKHGPVAGQPPELPGACTAAVSLAQERGVEGPLCSMSVLGVHCRGCWGQRTCDTHVPRPLAAEWHMPCHEAVPTPLLKSPQPCCSCRQPLSSFLLCFKHGFSDK